MTITIVLLFLIIIIAYSFEYINGFHDSANSIATIISTKALNPRYAILYAAVLNFAGAFFGTHVAQTISKGLIASDYITQLVMLSALLGAIIWNLITWFLGLPSSSSHALIGGLLGAALSRAFINLEKMHEIIISIPSWRIEHPAIQIINLHNLLNKVLIPMILSPILGFIVGSLVILILLKIFYKVRPEILNKTYRKLQLFSSGFLAFSHGSNDAQKTMGIITLSLLTYGVIQETTFEIPVWVICSCAFMLSLGTMTGGWKIIRTISSKMVKLKPIHGFSVEIASASIILASSHFGFPISTTQVISSAIVGVGSIVKKKRVKWGVVKNIVLAWIFTIPTCMLISAIIYTILYKTPLEFA